MAIWYLDKQPAQYMPGYKALLDTRYDILKVAEWWKYGASFKIAQEEVVYHYTIAIKSPNADLL